MDYRGQSKCEAVCFYVVLVSCVVSFVTGVVTQQLSLVFKVYGGGILLALLAGVPNWPWFNKHPLKWLKRIENTNTK